jgi:hypothetical protein
MNDEPTPIYDRARRHGLNEQAETYTAELGSTRDWVRDAQGILLVWIILLLLVAGPALVIAAWRWAL